MESWVVKGLHRFTLDKFSLCRGFDVGQSIKSGCFTVGGREWAVIVFPIGHPRDNTGRSYEQGHIYFDLFVKLMSESDDVPIRISFTLLDQTGNGDHLTMHAETAVVISTGMSKGFLCFIDRVALQRSSYLKDDCLKIECTLSVVLPSETKTISPSIAGDDDVGVDLLAMLKSAKGSDVVLSVKGEKFRAHKVILSVRSSVFAKLLVSGNQEIVLRDVEPRVMKALLHFIYSDALPKNDKSLIDGYAFGPSVSGTFGVKLLAAADRYDVKRLKSICEAHLWRGICLSRFAEILSIAGKYNASELKNLCFKYGADNYGVLVEMGSFCYLEKNFPLLFSELNDYYRDRYRYRY